MAKFRVEGGHRLSGEIVPQGAKNEALQIICATLLTSERVVVKNVPIIAQPFYQLIGIVCIIHCARLECLVLRLCLCVKVVAIHNKHNLINTINF
mgnify:CR=1 FL=1